MDHPTRICKWCEKPFTPSPGPGRVSEYCGQKCQRDAQYDRRKARIAPHRGHRVDLTAARSCLTCGADLAGTPLNRLRCSGCADAEYAQRKSDKAAEAAAARPKTPNQLAREAGKAYCSACKTAMELSTFTLRSSGKPVAWCKPCTTEYARLRNRRLSGIPLDAPIIKGSRTKPIGSTFMVDTGYVYEKTADHHRADAFGWVLQHILVAEAKYGIPITRDFSVHHRNGDRSDNRPENLDLRVGAHGTGYDVLPALLYDESMRADAAEILRSYGWHVSAPAAESEVA